MKKCLILGFLFVVSAVDVYGAMRSNALRIYADGISQEELDQPMKISIKFRNIEREVDVVPVRVYLGELPHQIRKQWLIELYDIRNDRRLVLPLAAVKFVN